jgi:hypothetical protein
MRKTRREQPLHIDAWEVVPDHMHCVWTLLPGDDDFFKLVSRNYLWVPSYVIGIGGCNFIGLLRAVCGSISEGPDGGSPSRAAVFDMPNYRLLSGIKRHLFFTVLI